jgi:cytochrome c oxidase cbb3-type subunit 4
MDINIALHSFSPVLVLLAFIGICWWAYSPRRRRGFEEAARLPFADEPDELNGAQKSNPAQTQQDSP